MWLMVKTLDLFYIIFTSLLIVPAFAMSENDSDFISEDTSSYFNSVKINSVLSDSMSKVDFDGQWTFKTEWKQSALYELGDTQNPMIVRIAHYDGFLYVHVNNLFDLTNNKSADRTVVCLSPEDSVMNNDYWCFVASRGINTGHTMQGNSQSSIDGNLKLISNPEGFVGIGGTSSLTDRYMLTPHAAYELKIPLDFIGNSQNYKFFIKTIDNQSVYTFPENLMESSHGIPSIEYWGTLSSKDKTIG